MRYQHHQFAEHESIRRKGRSARERERSPRNRGAAIRSRQTALRAVVMQCSRAAAVTGTTRSAVHLVQAAGLWRRPASRNNQARLVQVRMPHLPEQLLASASHTPIMRDSRWKGAAGTASRTRRRSALASAARSTASAARCTASAASAAALTAACPGERVKPTALARHCRLGWPCAARAGRRPSTRLQGRANGPLFGPAAGPASASA